jgi:hypothetical protein
MPALVGVENVLHHARKALAEMQHRACKAPDRSANLEYVVFRYKNAWKPCRSDCNVPSKWLRLYDWRLGT